MIDIHNWKIGYPGQMTECPICGCESEDFATCEDCSMELLVQYQEERNGDLPG